MTVAIDDRRKEYPGNGVSLVFTGPRAFVASHIAVYLVDDATQVATLQTGNYTIAGIGGRRPTTITMTGAPHPGGTTLLILRTLPYEQDTDITNQGRYLPEVLEGMGDKLAMQVQQVADGVNRSLRIADTATGIGTPEVDISTAVALGPVVLNANKTGFEIGDPLGTGDMLLRPDLASPADGKGANLMSYKASGLGAVSRSLQAQLDDTRTVHNFGAVGDGVTDDSAAFLAMAAATAGRIVLLEREYWVGHLTLSGLAQVSLLGAKMPRKNAALNGLTSGTVVIGRVTMRCNDVVVKDFGVDSGTSRANAVAAGITEGLVIDAVSGETGNHIVAHNVACLGASEANPTHGFLCEGYNSCDIDNIYAANHRFGLVYKGRSGLIRNIDAEKIDSVACYVKSDLPAFAGNVANATVSNVQVRNVQHRASSGNVVAVAVAAHASSAACANVQIATVRQTFGNNAVQIIGPGTIGEPPISSVKVTDVIGDSGAGESVIFIGYNYDCSASDITAINPASGKAVSTSSVSTGFNISGVNVLISSGGILGTEAMSLGGSGQWDNVTVRNGTQMTINQGTNAYGTIVPGQYSGNVRISGEQNLTFNNLVGAGTPTPTLKINPGGIVELRGQLNLTVATGTSGLQAATLPITVTGPRVFLCGGKNNSGVDTTYFVTINGTALSIAPAYTGHQYVDLSGITFRF